MWILPVLQQRAQNGALPLSVSRGRMWGRAVLQNGEEAHQAMLLLRPSIMRLCAVWCYRPGQDPRVLPVRRGRVRRAVVQAGLPHSAQGVPVPGPHVRLRAVHGLGLAAAAHHVPVRRT